MNDQNQRIHTLDYTKENKNPEIDIPIVSLNQLTQFFINYC